MGDCKVPISIFKTSNEQIDIVEAFNIWNLLNTRYTGVINNQLLLNFVHDRDFSLIINDHINHY